MFGRLLDTMTLMISKICVLNLGRLLGSILKLVRLYGGGVLPSALNLQIQDFRFLPLQYLKLSIGFYLS